MVGLFFYIQSKELNYDGFLFHAIEEEDAENYGEMLTDFLGHDRLFEQTFPNSEFEYFDFPRGRVVFDTVSKKHIIYVDSCIRSKRKITEIKKIFSITGECKLKRDEHYVCKNCIGDIWR